MAQEIKIPGATSTAKIRGVVAVPVLGFITLGIYTVVWYYKINRELADYGRAHGKTDELGDSPLTSLLAITLGALIIVPAIVSIVRTFKRIQTLERIADENRQPINGWIGLLAAIIFSPVLHGYMQSGLNNAWQALTGAAPAAAMPTATD